MNEPKTPSEQAPGHYGAGYGEQVPAGVPPRPSPTTDASGGQSASASSVDDGADSVGTADPTTVGDDGAPVVFTSDDVGARPPDRPPTENAPESEKAGLIFERS